MAGKKKPIDPAQVVKLARLGCTTEEIGDILGCSHDTITRRFATELARARAERRMSLRRAQTLRAIRDRSDTMLIHLGKHELGQTEAQEESRMSQDDLIKILKAGKQAREQGQPGPDRPGPDPQP